MFTAVIQLGTQFAQAGKQGGFFGGGECAAAIVAQAVVVGRAAYV